MVHRLVAENASDCGIVVTDDDEKYEKRYALG